MNTDTTKLYLKALYTFGVGAQTTIAMEELAEASAALSQVLRGRISSQEVASEIADAQIMLEQMQISYGIADCEVEAVRQQKLERLARRLEEASPQKPLDKP